MTPDHAHVLLDALALLDESIRCGEMPWKEHDGGDKGPKIGEAGYRALITEARAELDPKPATADPAPATPATITRERGRLRYHFTLRADQAITVTNAQGVPVDLIWPADADRRDDQTLAQFADDWMNRHAS